MSSVYWSAVDRLAREFAESEYADRANNGTHRKIGRPRRFYTTTETRIGWAVDKWADSANYQLAADFREEMIHDVWKKALKIMERM